MSFHSDYTNAAGYIENNSSWKKFYMTDVFIRICALFQVFLEIEICSFS